MSTFEQDLCQLESRLKADYSNHSGPLYADAYRAERAFLEKHSKDVFGANVTSGGMQAQIDRLHDRMQKDIGTPFVMAARIDNGQIVFDSKACTQTFGWQGFSLNEYIYSPPKGIPNLAEKIDLADVAGKKILQVGFADGTSQTLVWDGKSDPEQMTFVGSDGQTAAYDTNSGQIKIHKGNTEYRYLPDGTITVLEGNRSSQFHPDGTSTVTSFDPHKLQYVATDISQSIAFGNGTHSFDWKLSKDALNLNLGKTFPSSIPIADVTIDGKPAAQYLQHPTNHFDLVFFRDKDGNTYSFQLSTQTIEKTDKFGVSQAYDLTQNPPILIYRGDSHGG